MHLYFVLVCLFCLLVCQFWETESFNMKGLEFAYPQCVTEDLMKDIVSLFIILNKQWNIRATSHQDDNLFY